MGLFSFLKNAGAKLFGKKAEENDAVKEAADEAAEVAKKVASLTGVINASGIEVEDLSIELNDDTAVIYGKVNSVSDKEKVVLMVGNTEDIATVDDPVIDIVSETYFPVALIFSTVSVRSLFISTLNYY